MIYKPLQYHRYMLAGSPEVKLDAVFLKTIKSGKFFPSTNWILPQ